MREPAVQREPQGSSSNEIASSPGAARDGQACELDLNPVGEHPDVAPAVPRSKPAGYLRAREPVDLDRAKVESTSNEIAGLARRAPAIPAGARPAMRSARGAPAGARHDRVRKANAWRTASWIHLRRAPEMASEGPAPGRSDAHRVGQVPLIPLRLTPC